MPRTFEPIASVSPSAATTVEFTSIPSTFTDLAVVYSLTHSTGTVDLAARFNSDAGNNYSYTVLSGTGSSATSARQSSQAWSLVDYYAIPGTSERAISVINIMSYANTNVFKTFLAAPARAGAGVDRMACLWRSTNAITSVTLAGASGGGGFGVGTITGTVSLYGIKAA